MIKKKALKKILKICYLKDNFNPSRKPSSVCEFHLNASWRTTYRLHMYFPSSQKLTYTSKLKLQKWFLFTTTYQHECLQATTILPLKSKLSLAFEGHQSRMGESRGTSRMVLGYVFCGMGKLTPEPYECKANTLPTELLCPQPWKELIGKTDEQNGTHTKIYIKSGKLRKERREESEQMRGKGQNWVWQNHSMPASRRTFRTHSKLVFFLEQKV